jgi:hypothetical protein
MTLHVFLAGNYALLAGDFVTSMPYMSALLKTGLIRDPSPLSFGPKVGGKQGSVRSARTPHPRKASKCSPTVSPTAGEFTRVSHIVVVARGSRSRSRSPSECRDAGGGGGRSIESYGSARQCNTCPECLGMQLFVPLTMQRRWSRLLRLRVLYRL